MAMAVADAEAHVEVQRLIEEQAALRRVATLAAQGVEPAEIFSAVSDEVAQLFAASGLVLRFEEDGLGIVSVGISTGNDIPVGAHWDFEKGMASLEVHRTGRSARVDAFDWSSGSGPAAETAERVGIVSSVSNPILVQNRLWGALTVFSTSERLPNETEDRLEKFSQLVAAAIANAENKAELAMSDALSGDLADEQAALHRVARLVAEGAESPAVFEAVCAEAGQLIGASSVNLAHYTPDNVNVTMAGWSLRGTNIPVGTRLPLAPDTVGYPVRKTSAPARLDSYEDATSELGTLVRDSGIRSTVAAPVIVEGELWGALIAGTDREELLPIGVELRLARFSELIATAIANAESRDRVRRLADEQAALRRVATLVAQGAPPGEVFSEVTKEVARVFSRVDAPLVATVIRFDPGPEGVLVGASRAYELEPVGSRWEPKDLYVSTRVLRTGRSARVDEVDLETAGGPDADVLRLRGFLYQVGSPVVVEGSLWGAMTLNSSEALPPDTDESLEKFTQLIATAISNAEARDSLRRLADEQAALRRVATLVAEGTAPTDLFAAVAVEVAAVVGVSSGSVSRFLPDGSSVVLASHNDPGFPVGSRWLPDGGTINASILEAARPARIDQKMLSGPIAEASRISNVRSAVAAPIVVEGSVWGMVAVGRQHSDEPLPPQTETRLAAFTQLIATAIANAESRDELTLLADEQAALRRVATLVAEGAPPDALFRAVADEVASVVGLPAVTLSHHHADGSFTVAAATNNPGFPVGSRWPLEGPSLAATIHETGRVARIDDYSKLGGAVAAAMDDSSFHAAAGSPIVVDGKVWGHISVELVHTALASL